MYVRQLYYLTLTLASGGLVVSSALHEDLLLCARACVCACVYVCVGTLSAIWYCSTQSICDVLQS